MAKPKYKYDPPTKTFPYKIKKRINLLSVPQTSKSGSNDSMPAYTPRGVRVSAINGQNTERQNEAAWPTIRRLAIMRRQYSKKFPPERLAKIDRMMEASNATIYTKLANQTIEIKKSEAKDMKKKKGWSESEWKKHMEYIMQIAAPKKTFEPDPVDRGEKRKLDEMLPRINIICEPPNNKKYKRLSQESMYRNPIKVSPKALKYIITEHTRKLATPRVIPAGD